MIPVLLIAGLFTAVASLLRFTTWAEGWLAPNPVPNPAADVLAVAQT